MNGREPSSKNAREEEPKLLGTGSKHQTNARAELTHATRNAFRHIADRHAYPAQSHARTRLSYPLIVEDKFTQYLWDFLRPKAKSPEETYGLRCRGLGKSVQGRVAFRGQSAAHDQITERKHSVPYAGICFEA